MGLACSGGDETAPAGPKKPSLPAAPAAVPAGVAIASAPNPSIKYPPTPTPAENPASDDKALLGKFLFWEEQMSADDTVACGTCHRPAAGGSDPRSSESQAFLAGLDQVMGTGDDIHGSPGIVRCEGSGTKTGAKVQVTGRKAPTYLDAGFDRQLFWDGRAECAKQDCPSGSAFEDPDHPGTFPIAEMGALESQAVGPPLSDVEMACVGTTWPMIHTKLARVTPLALARQLPAAMQQFRERHGTYPRMFEAAFADQQTSGRRDEINTRRIAFAIATHERRLRSDQTPWDRWNAGDTSALTPVQVWGFDLFTHKAACGSCHKTPLFSDGAFHYTGFYPPAWDEGRGVFSKKTWERGAMRTATLRNVGLREPGGLLHTGAGAGSSLNDIVAVYNDGGRPDVPEVLAVPISPSVEKRNLSADEVLAIVEFMRFGLTDPRVQREEPPFDRPKLSTE